MSREPFPASVGPTDPVGRQPPVGITLPETFPSTMRGVMVTADGSVSRWLAQLRAGNHDAAAELWERYFRRLAALARLKLRGAPRRAASEEDVALSAFASFCRGVERGRFPELFDRGSLWRLLVVFTARKAAHQVRDETRLKRGGRTDQAPPPDDVLLEQAVSREPTPELAAQMAEDVHRLLERLGDATLEGIALWKMEGFTTDEIAARLGCAPRTVERKLRLIRRVWEEELAP